MSIFDKFKGKAQKETQTRQRAEEHTEPKASVRSPETLVPVTDLTSSEVYSEACLMQQLVRREQDFPQGPSQLEPFLSRIQDRIKQHIQLMNSYDTLLQAVNQAKARQKAEKERREARKASGEAADKDPVPETVIPEMPDSVDAQPVIHITPDRLTAFLYILPPVGEGKAVTAEDIQAALAVEGITTGILEDDLKGLAEKKFYYQVFTAARGSAPVEGKAGYLIDHYPRDQRIELREDEKGKVDLRDLNLFHNIKKDEIICDIIPPEDGIDGIDVKGTVLHGKKGMAAAVPSGKNTAVNKEGTALVSLADGEIMFQHGAFRVEPQLTIQKNVDTSVGNLDFAGDILIIGDVCQGFTVRAGGNVIVYGMAESGSTILAGEDIEIRKGVNGGGTGTLDAGGNISSRFLEHVKVRAKGNISAENIINCNIVCGGRVEVLSGRGTIIGGTISAAECVEAKKIGTLSNNETVIKIGCSILEEENVESVTAQLNEAKKTLEMISKNYRYLYNLPSLPENKKALFQTISEQKTIYEKLVRELTDKLNDLLNRKPDYRKCHVKSSIIYGITEINLGYSKLIIKDAKDQCNVYCKDNELVMGTF